MGFSKYLIWIVLQIVFIAITSLLFAFTITKNFMIVTNVSLVIAWAFQIVLLIFHINKIKRDLQRFIDGLKSQDTALIFKQEKKDKFFKSLHEEFNEIMRDFKIIKKEKELEGLFFQQIMKHIGVGILAIGEKNRILLTNSSLLNLLSKREIKSIDELQTASQNLPQIIKNLRNNEQKVLLLETLNQKRSISLYASEFILDSKLVKIISFQDISKEIDKTEVDAWNKLFRVITHEIMNSVSPIRLLSGGLIDYCKDIAIEETAKKEISDGLFAIKKRSEGLSHFIENYRKLTRIPTPQIKEINLASLLSNIEILFAKELSEKNIACKIMIEPQNLTISADEKQIEQVIINLIKNAIDALSATPSASIIVSASQDTHNKSTIEISNNGEKIPEEVKENMFIPFFTTKEKGSGIGLSLSRQIMRLHGGEIQLRASANLTVFEVSF